MLIKVGYFLLSVAFLVLYSAIAASVLAYWFRSTFEVQFWVMITVSLMVRGVWQVWTEAVEASKWN